MPLPRIEGQVVRCVELHCSDGSSNKDYNIKIATLDNQGFRVYFEHGPSGRVNQGGEKTEISVSFGSAVQLADALAQSKLDKGYRTINDRTFAFAGAAPPLPPQKPKRRKTAVRGPAFSAQTLSVLNRFF